MKHSKILTAILFVTFSFQTRAADFVVTSFVDAPDTLTGDGQCIGQFLKVPGCTLRAAIMEANSTDGPHNILLPVGSEYILTAVGGDEDNAVLGDLDIRKEIKILTGHNDGWVINGNFTDRVFQVHAEGKLTLMNGRVKNGYANTEDTFQGGAVKVEIDGILHIDDVDFSNNLANRGGAIFNDGLTTMVNSYIHNNAITSENEPFALPSQGSAILNRKNMILSSTTVGHNGKMLENPNNTTINQNEYSIHINPNGINADQPNTIIFNSTIAQNKAGGIQLEGGITDINQTTIALQTGQGIRFVRRGGDYKGTLQLKMRKTVVANNGGQDCNDLQALYSNVDAAKEIELLENFNISSDDHCGFLGMDNLENANVLFNGELNNWGGKTPTLLPLFSINNDILDFVVDDVCTSEDQRGGMRPLDGKNNGISFCDVGSVELNMAEDMLESDVIFKNGFEQD